MISNSRPTMYTLPPTEAVSPGSTIGSYRIVSKIGQGGMGDVWIASHTLLGRRAAIKVLRPSLSASEEMVTRFFNEARAAAAIADPGIVQVFDFGYHTDGSAYIVLELLDGEPLDRRLARVGRLAVGDALRAMRQVASSLGAAHARQIIHRDLKPENIFLVRDPEVASGERAKILDFGIAKLSGDPFALETHTSALMGTPMFMSPEQCRGAARVDQRSDVYALGCVLFTLIVGRPPFEASGVGDMIAKHLTEPPPRASSFVGSIPPEVDDLILCCMAKNPDQRFANGGALASAIAGLNALASRTPVAFTVPPGLQATMLPTPAPIVPTTTRSPLTTLSGSAAAGVTPPPTTRRSHIVAVAGSVLAASVLAGWIAMRVSSSGAVQVTSRPGVAAPMLAPAPTPPAVERTITPNKPSDPRVTTANQQLRRALAGFRRWSELHPTAGCPNANELSNFVAGGLIDPWGTTLVVTCTGQPANQIVGVISNGPDGIVGSRDDIASWNLGGDATDVVRGDRWAPAPPKPMPMPPRAQTAVHPTQPIERPNVQPEAAIRDPFGGTQIGNDGIPTTR